jgi:hypothetical protein
MQRLQQAFVEPQDEDMMGPLLRRKRVVSVPLGSTGDGFFSAQPKPNSTAMARHSSTVAGADQKSREPSWPPPGVARTTRRPHSLSLGMVLKRKQVSLDLFAPEQADFFADVPEEEEISPFVAPGAPGEGTEVAPTAPATEGEGLEPEEEVKLFRPLRFSTPVHKVALAPGHTHHGPGPGPPCAGPVAVDDEIRETMERQIRHNQELKVQIDMLSDILEDGGDREQEKLLEDIQCTQGFVESDALALQSQLLKGEELPVEGILPQDEEPEEFVDDSNIIRATRDDYIWTGVLLCLMIAFTAAVIGWDTHLDESFSVFGDVGLACATPCTGDLESQDYFNGHSHFETGQFIQLTMMLDPKPFEAQALVQIVGAETGEVKAELLFGPPFPDIPAVYQEKIEVNFDHPHEEHIINVTSTDPDVTLTYKLNASRLSHLAKNSELIAALIMILVYIFILLEVIHRTLVAIFGSMIALLFFFIIHEVRLHNLSHIDTRTENLHSPSRELG